jgi:hypothetical protein
MPTYRLPDPEHLAVLDDVLRTIHPRLADAGVTVGLLLAHAKVNKDGEMQGPALKLHGVACAALVRVTKLKDRVKGVEDAMIEIDADEWGNRPLATQRAILDHECSHLIIVTDGKTGVVETDDAGRPKLKLKPDDYTINGQFDVIERHGKDALETQTYADLHRVLSQKLLPFG